MQKQPFATTAGIRQGQDDDDDDDDGGGTFIGLGRGGRVGFLHGAVKSFLNNENTFVFQGNNYQLDKKKVEEEGQFDDLEEEDVGKEELESHLKKSDDDNDEKNGVTEIEADDDTNQKEQHQKFRGGDERSNSFDNRKSVKDRYDVKESQQKRREELLGSQKQRRDKILDKIRQLETTSSDSELEEDEDFVKLVKENKTISKEKHEPLEEMEVLHEQDNNRQRRPRNRYRKPNKERYAPCRVMLSEWMLEKPEDFEKEWMGILCPVGKRCLVVARRGKTYVFSRTNEYMGIFESQLPGGGKISSRDPEIKKKKGVTILDCIWSMEAEVFYVLDLVCWASQSYNNCTKSYRQFFQTSKISENPQLMARSDSNPYPFLPLPSFDCSEIAVVMNNVMPIFKQQVDGLLLFHKESFYFNGVNPLCLWIYLTDLEEKLQISVTPELAACQRVRAQRPPRPEKHAGGGGWRQRQQKPMDI